MQRVLQKRKDVSKTRSKMKFQACGQVLPFWITGANSHFKLYWPPWWGKGQPIRDLWAAELGPMDANFGLKSRHGLLTYPCLMMRRHCFSCTCTSCLWTYFRQGAVLGAGHTIRPCFASVPNTSLPLVSSLKKSRSGHLTGYLLYMADGSLLVFSFHFLWGWWLLTWLRRLTSSQLAPE